MVGSQGRFVLIIGDEGALLCDIRNRTLVRQAFGASPQQADEISALLMSRPKQAVSVLVNVLDIALRREGVPPAAFWELGVIVRRRMARAFPHYQYSGAMSLGRQNGGRRDHLYLLAGVAPSTAFDSWMTFLYGRANPLRDVALLPIEATRLMDRIAEEFAAGRDNNWRVMITRERTGGFRQVIMRDGVIAFSRLTQSVEPEATVEDMATAVEAEFGHTVDYLKRLGFSPGDGLDLVIVGDDALRDALARRDFIATRLLLLSPQEISGRLGLGDASGQDDGFSDLLHALAFVSYRRPILQLRSSGMVTAQQSRRRLAAAYVATAATIGVVMLYVLVLIAGIHSDRKSLAELEQGRLEQRAELMALESEIASLPRSLEQMVAELRNWSALRTESIDPGPILARLAPVINDKVMLSAVDWRLVSTETSGRRNSPSTQSVSDRNLQMRITLALSGVGGDRVAAVSLGSRLADELRKIYADFAVSIPRLPVPIRPDETLRVEGGIDSVDRTDRPVTMEVLVEGPRVESAE